MKTTLDLDDDLLAEAKSNAAAAGTSLREYVEDALRARLAPPSSKTRKPFRLTVPIVDGVAPPTVEVMDRTALYDFLEEPA